MNLPGLWRSPQARDHTAPQQPASCCKLASNCRALRARRQMPPPVFLTMGFSIIKSSSHLLRTFSPSVLSSQRSCSGDLGPLKPFPDPQLSFTGTALLPSTPPGRCMRPEAPPQPPEAARTGRAPRSERRPAAARRRPDTGRGCPEPAGGGSSVRGSSVTRTRPRAPPLPAAAPRPPCPPAGAPRKAEGPGVVPQPRRTHLFSQP